MEIRKCPFLLKWKGNDGVIHYSCNRYDGTDRLDAQEVSQFGCEREDFVDCETYREATYFLRLGLPLVCPLIDEREDRCKKDHGECENYQLCVWGGYLRCPTFSEWFWSKGARGKEEARWEK